MKIFDAVIAGSGPAGCAAAIFLARKGYDVFIADKARFPRDKTCGDGLTASAISLLQKLGIMDFVERKLGPPNQFRSILLSSPAGDIIEGFPPTKEGLTDYGYVIPREELDSCLVECLKKTGKITLMEETEITGIVKKKEQIIGIKSSTREFFGQCVIGADGPYSIIASGMSRLNRHRKQMGFALRAYFNGVSGIKNSIEIHYDKNMIPGYGWLFPVGKKRANVGVGIFTRFKNNHGIKKMFEGFINENPFVSVKLKDAEMEPGSLKGWPLPLGSFPGKRGCKNLLLAGDAGSFVDPLNGEGIYYALKTGQYAAESIDRSLRQGQAERAGRIYEKLWRKEFLVDDFLTSYLMQPLLSNKFFLNFAIKLASQKQKRADLLAGVIGHKLKKRSLLKILF